MYVTGTITDANPGAALHTAMASALTTAGFTLVDTVVISTRTHKIWKSAAANNAQGLDWYLDVIYTTTGAGTFSLVPFEFFDPATDLGYRGPHSAPGSTIDAATFSRYGATGQTLENTAWVSASGSYTWITSPLVTTSFGYWVSVTGDRVSLLQSNDASRPLYAGFYQPDSLHAAKAGAGLYPLTAARLMAANSSSAANPGSVSASLTRVPPITAFTGNWSDHLLIEGLGDSGMAVQRGQYPSIPAGSTVAHPLVAVPVEMWTFGMIPSTRWGTLRDVVQFPSSGVARGDTVTIDGSTYVATTTTSGMSFAFKAV